MTHNQSSTRIPVGSKRDVESWHMLLTQWGKETILPDFGAVRIIRSGQVHIWTRPRCQGGFKLKNTLRDRCRHISGLLVQTSYGLRALMQSALPLLITTAASRALYLIRVKGSRSDLSCHQRDPTSHRAARLLHVLMYLSSKTAMKRFDTSSFMTWLYSIRTDATDARIGRP